MQRTRAFPARRSPGATNFFHAVRIAAVAMLYLVARIRIPIVAAVLAIFFVPLLLFDLLDTFWPGRVVPRPKAAILGEDGVWTHEGFIGWHDVAHIQRMELPSTRVRVWLHEQMNAKKRQRGEAVERLAGPVVAMIARKDQTVVQVEPAKVRRFVDEARERLARARKAAGTEVETDYRSASEMSYEVPEDAALDTSLPVRVRVQAFSELEPAARASVLGSMADEQSVQSFTEEVARRSREGVVGG